MQTAFDAAQLTVPAIADADQILKDCVHYGFCTAVCPTYVLLRDELDAPRGRIDLIREMLEAGGRPSARTVGYIDRCLSCNACMTTCAARVDYMHLADIARAYIEANFRRPLFDRLFRWLLALTVPDTGRFRAAVRLARLAKPAGGLLPDRLANLLALAPGRLPPVGAAMAPGTYPAIGTPEKRVVLLTGCVQQALAPQINRASISLLTRHGCEVVVSEAAACCGAFTLHMGREGQAKTSARATIEAWHTIVDAGRVDAILVNASGCGTTVKDYGRIFTHNPDIAEKARRIADLALDVSEFLPQLKLKPPRAAVPLKVAYHDACSLQHAQKVRLPPRQLLSAAGFVVRDVPEAHFCCGSAGAYNMLQPAIARTLGDRKARHIESTGAQVVAAGNLGCLTQIGLHSELPALHTVELLDWATGGPLPAPLEGIRLPDPIAGPHTRTTEPSAGIW